MKKTKLLNLLILMVLLMTTSCNNKQQQQNMGIKLDNLDTLVRPQDDFYQFACGGWKVNNPLTSEYARYGNFDKLRNENQERLKTLIEAIASEDHKAGTVDQKIGDLFAIAMDSSKLNKDGFLPIVADLEKIEKATSVDELKKLLPEFQYKGYDLLFAFYVDADPRNSNKNLVQSYQTGTSMGQRDYYLEQDENTQNIRTKYVEHIEKMFELAGVEKAEAKKHATNVMTLETRLAKSEYDNVKLRDPYANYNKMSFEELQKNYTAIDWKKYFSSFTKKEIDTVSISQKENFAEVNKVLQTESLESLKSYFKWKVIDGAAAFLSDEFNKANFNFYSTVLSGIEEQKPRWKRAVSTVNGSLGEAVGQLYVKEYFPPEAKERMVKLVNNLQTTLKDRIEKLTWMGDTTKVKAVDKLNTFHVKIGYPDKWKDYSSLEISKGDSYWENMTRVSQFMTNRMIEKIGKPVDKDKWLMSPQTVNAYYQPSTNEICFPAAILQPPFFDMTADDAFNYGAIGVVIGHEMTHGFDDQGSLFDKDGNLNSWWTEKDRSNFEQRADVLVKHFDNIEVAPGVHGNGKFTLGENIADFGGVQISYQALNNTLKDKPLETENGFTPQQRFFLAYANVWAGHIRPEEILNLTKTDPHSLGEWRVNGTLPHINAWYEAFDVKETDKLFIPKDKRANIW